MKILGLTSPVSFNSAAAAVDGGRLVAAVEEERFVHLKHAPRLLPKLSVDYCLKILESKLESLDAIAVGHEDPLGHFWGVLKASLRGEIEHGRASAEQELAFWTTHLFGMRNLKGTFVPDKSRLRYYPHHLSHAASAFYCSGFEKAAIVSLDGRGGYESGMLATGEGKVIRPLAHIPIRQSWGLYYELFTKALGFRHHSEEGKVMGLAAYGKPGLVPFVDLSGDFPRIDNAAMAKYFSEIAWRKPSDPITDEHRDLAARCQHTLEEAGLKIARWTLERSGTKNLCLAGGVALNCSMNGRLWRDLPLDGIFVQPASSDSGTAIGAALLAHVELTGERPDSEMRHAYLGPDYSNAEIEDAIRKSKVTNWKKSDDIASDTAKLVADGKILAWMQGRMEIGPRALGGRSIVADPRRAEMKDIVNRQVKWREPWRPFAPSIQEERVAEYVSHPVWSPFMIVAFQSLPEAHRRIPAAVHVDGTARVQTVSRATNPKYWDLLEAFRKLTGEAVVLNTSFNVKGQPIVNTPLEAISTLYSCGLDGLAIGDYLILK